MRPPILPAWRDRLTRTQAWIDSRPAREQQLLRGALVLAPLLLVWLWVWEPLHDAHARLVTALPAARAQAVEFERQANAIERQPGRPAQDRQAARSPQATIETSATRNGLGGAIRRVEAMPGDRLQVRIESADFTTLIRWLGRLSADDGLVIDQLQVQGMGPGQVRVEQLVLVPVGRRGAPAAAGSPPAEAR